MHILSPNATLEQTKKEEETLIDCTEDKKTFFTVITEMIKKEKKNIPELKSNRYSHKITQQHFGPVSSLEVVRSPLISVVTVSFNGRTIRINSQKALSTLCFVFAEVSM